MRGLRRFRRFAIACGLGACFQLASAQSAQAAILLEWDINNIGIQAMSVAGAPIAFGGTTHTGSLALSTGGGSVASVRIDGVDQDGTGGADAFVGTLNNLTGVINLVNGQVQGGSLTFDVTSVHGTDSYSLAIADTDSPVLALAGENFALAGITFNGDLNDGSFAGVNVQPWSLAEPLFGEILIPTFSPSANGFDNAIIELSAVVPEPASIAVTSLLAGGLLLRRKRSA